MIDGLGIDIEEIDRFSALLNRWGRHFTEKIFTAQECAYCESKFRPAQHFAARFAAKEAIAKALGTGWRGQFAWKDIEVRNDASGKPEIFLYHGLKESLEGKSVELSLTHTTRYAAAVVIIQHNTQDTRTQEVP